MQPILQRAENEKEVPVVLFCLDVHVNTAVQLTSKKKHAVKGTLQNMNIYNPWGARMEAEAKCRVPPNNMAMSHHVRVSLFTQSCLK